MSACGRYRDYVRGRPRGASLQIPDDLALHLDACSRCRQEFDADKVPFQPDDFEVLPRRARRRALAVLAAARVRPRRRAAAVLAGVAAGALLLLVTLNALDLRRPPLESASPPVVAALAEDHISYLSDEAWRSAGEPPDPQGYLAAYVDFPVHLPELPGGRVVGARRCFLLGRRVALAFYETPHGPVSYFVLPAADLNLPTDPCAGDEMLACASYHGYHVVGWTGSGLFHALVGAGEGSLTEMARRCRRPTGAGAGARKSDGRDTRGASLQEDRSGRGAA